MSERREFLKSLAAASALGLVASPLSAQVAAPSGSPADAAEKNVREQWLRWLERITAPVLNALSQRELKRRMPVEAHVPKERAPVTHLEALGRSLMGLAPWLELAAASGEAPEETSLRNRFAALAREGIDAATDPKSPDFMNFSEGRQPLVDAAFLAQAILRAPRELWDKLDNRVRAQVVNALKATRVIQPGESNWVLFAAMVETALTHMGEPRVDERLLSALRKFEQWYAGDGWYGDGPSFHTDYYNSYVIHPMLIEILDRVAEADPTWRDFRAKDRERFTRYAAIQERLISPDGSFPVIGRSIAYRAGAFQALALAALRHQLPANVLPAQVRVGLTSVLRRTLEAPGTFDAEGWLRIGLCGAQIHLAEDYISTGSLYLCTAAFLPLGLPTDDPFWKDPAAPTTWQKAWSGVDMPADHALDSPK